MSYILHSFLFDRNIVSPSQTRKMDDTTSPILEILFCFSHKATVAKSLEEHMMVSSQLHLNLPTVHHSRIKGSGHHPSPSYDSAPMWCYNRLAGNIQGNRMLLPLRTTGGGNIHGAHSSPSLLSRASNVWPKTDVISFLKTTEATSTSSSLLFGNGGII